MSLVQVQQGEPNLEPRRKTGLSSFTSSGMSETVETVTSRYVADLGGPVTSPAVGAKFKVSSKDGAFFVLVFG